MLKRYVCCLTLLILVGGSASTAGQNKQIEWKKDYDEAIKLAKELGKPVMIEFWASWCGPCQRMDREVWPHPEVVAESKKFVCIAVDVDRDGAVAAQYQARAIPTIVFADPWGNELSRQIGYAYPGDLTRTMKAFPSDFSGLSQWAPLLKEDDKNWEALCGVGAFYRQTGAWDLSNRYFKQALSTEAAKTDPALKENLLLTIGLNHLKLRDFKAARKSFEKCLKEVPSGSQCDVILLGLCTAQLQEGKIADAEKTFAQLKSQYPDSPAVEKAAKNLEAVKSARR
jgi:thiol-disulfide isomerase/thioredoxin